ncbi:MAG: F0F1 ATP synthase subunit B [Parcubacteria group bacterium]|nr:F0F1 ATP synthase subunit B [Parcubacteria group bacterium]
MAELLENLGINGKLLAAQVLNFLLVFWLLRRFVFKRLLDFIENRKREIAKGLELKATAEREVERTKVLREDVLHKAQGEAQQVMRETQARSQAMEQQQMSLAKRKAEGIVKSAKDQASREQEAALKELQGQVRDMAFAAAARVLARTISKKDQEKLTAELLHSVAQGYASKK